MAGAPSSGGRVPASFRLASTQSASSSCGASSSSGRVGGQFHFAEALAEAKIAAAQSHLRIDAEVAAEIDDGEEQVAEFGFDFLLAAPGWKDCSRWRLRLRARAVSSAILGSRSRQSGQSKPDLAAFDAELSCFGQSGHGALDSIEPRGFARSLLHAMAASAALISSQLRRTAADEPSTCESTTAHCRRRAKPLRRRRGDGAGRACG